MSKSVTWKQWNPGKREANRKHMKKIPKMMARISQHNSYAAGLEGSQLGSKQIKLLQTEVFFQKQNVKIYETSNVLNIWWGDLHN